MKKFLVSTADVYGYDSNDNLLFVGKTLLDSSIETTLSNTDVRAGKGNQLQYIYYHTAEMNITINEAQFSLEFLALNTEFTLADTSYEGTVCVRYYTNDAAARKVTVYADMLPSVIRLVMVGTLASSDATTNQIGTVQIEVPRASMTGAFTLSMTPDAVSQTPLSVRALASTEVAGGCGGNRPIYATITEKIDGANWYDNVIALAIEGGDFDLAKSTSKALQVYAIKNDGSAAVLAPINELTFSSSAEGTATADGGVVVGVAEGSATIKATITDVPEIDANIIVTVTGA